MLEDNTLKHVAEDHERLDNLFNSLDYNGDGFIDESELIRYMTAFYGEDEHNLEEEAKAIIARGDIKKDGKLDYQEFMLFMLEHERNLWEHFVGLDHDGSGDVCHSELMAYCKESGLDIPQEKLTELIKRLDKDGNLRISWDEFREFNQFKLTYSIASNSLKYFGSAYVDSIIALDIPSRRQNEAQQSGIAKKLVCGGIAGVVSRTATAPFDRVKVLLQVQGQQKVVGSSQNLGIRKMFKAMIEEGFFTMWRGNTINCLKIFPENAMRCFVFEQLCESGRLNVSSHDFINNQRMSTAL